MIPLYVDYILMRQSHQSHRTNEEVKSELKDFNPMKDYDLAEKILGIRMQQKVGCIQIDQETYTGHAV